MRRVVRKIKLESLKVEIFTLNFNTAKNFRNLRALTEFTASQKFVKTL